LRITIDNLDGAGPRDYTPSIAPEGPITLQRTLNSPTRLTAELVVGVEGLPLPSRLGRVIVDAEDGTALFTGYLATEPVRIYAGDANSGAVYRARLNAVSDEWLLDRAGSGAAQTAAVSLSLDGNQLLARMAARVQAGSLDVSSESGGLVSGVFTARADVPWSVNAGEAAGALPAGWSNCSGPGASADSNMSASTWKSSTIATLAKNYDNRKNRIRTGDKDRLPPGTGRRCAQQARSLTAVSQI